MNRRTPSPAIAYRWPHRTGAEGRPNKITGACILICSMRLEPSENGNAPAVTQCDGGLLRGLTARKKKAYVQAVERHYTKIYGFLYHMVGNAAIAEDLTQETFTSAWQALGGFEERSPVAVWLHQIALNAFRAHVRAQEPSGVALDEAIAGSLDEVRDHAERLEVAELQRRTQEAVWRLPELYREVIVLRYYQGLKHREVAELLGVPTGTVQFRCHVAFEKLRAELGREVHEDER